jgi:hypothetical protein
MSGGIANQRARATGAWEEKEHCWIIIRGVSGLFSPKLEPCCRSSLEASVSVESSLKVCYNSMSLDTVHLLFFNLSERALDSRSVEQRFLLCILLFFGLSNLGDEDTDSCMIFFHQPLLIFFIESWLTNQCSLEIKTRVLPWWSLSSSGMAKSCSINDTPSVLMIKEGASLIFACRLHLQWLRDIILQP